METVHRFYAERAAKEGATGAKTGAVTVVQRTSSDLRLNPHLHAVLLDGAWHERDGELVFEGLGHLKTSEVGEVLERVVRRIERHLRRRGLLRIDEDGEDRSGDGDPEGNLAASAVSGQAPPAGPQWVSGLAPLEPHALAYDKPLCASPGHEPPQARGAPGRGKRLARPRARAGLTSVPRLYYYAPLVGLTAWQAIVEVMHLRPGQKLLVHAGSGGVGTFAIQLARHMGLHVATTVSAASAGRAKDLGAAEIVDYRSGRFEDVLTGFDAVFDTLGMNLEGSFRVLKPGGIVVSVAAIPTAGTARELGRPWWVRGLLNIATRKIRHLAISQGKRYRFLFVRPSGETLATIASLVEAGTIRPVIDRVFPFAETKEALAYVESGRAKGKVVIKVR